MPRSGDNRVHEDAAMFLRSLAAQGRKRGYTRVKASPPEVQAVLVDLTGDINWDSLEEFIDDPGFYSQYIGMILFYDASLGLQGFGAEFYSTMEELWSDWEHLLQSGEG